LENEAFWEQYSFIMGLPNGFLEIKAILADKNYSLNMQLFKIKQITNSYLKDKVLRFFDKPIKPLVREFFNAIINNSLAEFKIKYQNESNPCRQVLLKSARHWG
jgi:hypothetical protein